MGMISMICLSSPASVCRAGPADACEENQSAADFISRYDGGRGAAREFIESILRSQGRWEEAVSSFQTSIRKISCSEKRCSIVELGILSD